jgi:hypothetical protein
MDNKNKEIPVRLEHCEFGVIVRQGATLDEILMMPSFINKLNIELIKRNLQTDPSMPKPLTQSDEFDAMKDDEKHIRYAVKPLGPLSQGQLAHTMISEILNISVTPGIYIFLKQTLPAIVDHRTEL